MCELDLNSRLSISRIAKKLRVSRNVIAYRIKNIEKQKVITSYVTSLNLGLLGYKTYKIYIKITPKSERELQHWLSNQKNVIHLLKTEGPFDYTMAIAVKQIIDLDDFLFELKGKFGDIIRDYQISIVVYSKIYKLHKLLLGKKEILPKVEKYSGEEKIISLDQKDRAILRVISQQANIPIVKLARETNLSLEVVKYRLHKLQKSVITSSRVTFDINKLGYHFYRILLRVHKAKKSEERRLVAWCSSRSEVLYCTKQIGYYDFEINCAITEITEYHTLLAELKKEFGRIIDSYDTMLISKLLKLDYVPF